MSLAQAYAPPQMAALLSLGRCDTPCAWQQRSLPEAHARTFRPRKAAVYTQLKQHIDATIGSGNLREAVSSGPPFHASCPLRVLTRFAASAGAAAAWGGLE